MLEPRQFTIRKEGTQYCLFAKVDGKKLGCHATRGDAEAQERAIKASDASHFCRACEVLIFSDRDAAEHEAKSHELAVLAFEHEDDEGGPSRTFLNALRDRIKGMFEKKGAITNGDFEEAIKLARSSAGGKHSSRKKKRADEGKDFSGIDGGDPRPQLAKADSVVKYREEGGTFESSCGKCRFFWLDSCRLVEGTIEVEAVCKLYRPKLEFGFGEFYHLTASELVDGAPARGEWAFYSPLELAEVEDGQWIAYLPAPDEYESPRYGKIVITAERNRRFVENFRSAVYQEKLPIDAEHETKLSGAMAWVVDMRQNSDGSVDAKVDWTDRGRSLMEGDQFKYFSPEFFDEWRDPASGEVYSDVAIGGALTTRPFFKEKSLRPLVASEGGIDALLDEDERAHFRGSKEARMTKKKEEKKGIFTRLAESLTASEGEAAVSEDELREELRTELAAPVKKDDAKAKVDADAKAKAKGSEGDLENIEGIPKAAAERITATELENKKLREDLVAQGAKTKSLEDSARSTRLTDMVAGKTKESTHRWFGEVGDNVKMLTELAAAVGEDSDVFKSVVKSHNAQAAQIAFAETVQLKERGYQGVSDVSDSPEMKVAAEARKIMTETPERYKTIEQARTAVWDAHPEWKAAAHTR